MSLLSTEDFRIIEDLGQKGMGLFANKEFRQGDHIYQMDYWSKPLMPMHATNHSCNPNASFNEHSMLVAVRNIAKDEEITYDYLRHPIPASPWNFKCLCQSENCVGWVISSGRNIEPIETSVAENL